MPPPSNGHEAEWLTRRKRIDTKLTSPELGWKIIPHKEGMDGDPVPVLKGTPFAPFPIYPDKIIPAL